MRVFDSAENIKKGDDISVTGVVTAVNGGCIQITTRTGNQIWIEPGDIKMVRPNYKEGGK